MKYSSVISSYDNSVALEGRTILAVYSKYSFAALLLDKGEVVAFSVEEFNAGHWFEVFPICRHQLTSDFTFAWTQLAEPIIVTSSEQIWREEWMEPSAESTQYIGSGPHFTQYAAALGEAPESNDNVVKVLAGIKLLGQDDSSLVVCSSDNTPFQIDLAINKCEIEQIMQFHTCR